MHAHNLAGTKGYRNAMVSQCGIGRLPIDWRPAIEFTVPLLAAARQAIVILGLPPQVRQIDLTSRAYSSVPQLHQSEAL